MTEQRVVYMPNPFSRHWWCNTHQRQATHIRCFVLRPLEPCCDPVLEGILLPCSCVHGKPAADKLIAICAAVTTALLTYCSSVLIVTAQAIDIQRCSHLPCTDGISVRQARLYGMSLILLQKTGWGGAGGGKSADSAKPDMLAFSRASFLNSGYFLVMIAQFLISYALLLRWCGFYGT